MEKQATEVFSRKLTNTADITAGNVFAVDYRQEAEKTKGKLPHNVLILANTNSSCTLFVFLDDYSDVNTPDYVVFPNQQLSVPIDDGIRYTTLFIKNTHATNTVNANELKIKISTVKVV